MTRKNEPGGDEAALAAVGTANPSALLVGLHLALGDVALDVDLNLARADLVRVGFGVGRDHLEVGHGLELECTCTELLEVVERCNCVHGRSAHYLP